MTGEDKSRLRERREHLMRLLYLREFYEADESNEQNQLYFDVILPNEGILTFTGNPDEENGQNDSERNEILNKYNLILEKLPEIDSLLTAKMQNWNINRIGLVEKAILRISAYEIIFGGLEKKVSINEAVELAKQYGGSQSSGFVNGVLAKIIE